MKIRVYYEDTDVGGRVYHSRYLNFCERARSELFFQEGKSPVHKGYHFVIKELTAHYHAPAFLGDVLEVRTHLTKMTRISVELEQVIWRKSEKIFTLTIVLVCLQKERPSRIPEYFQELFQKLS